MADSPIDDYKPPDGPYCDNDGFITVFRHCSKCDVQWFSEDAALMRERVWLCPLCRMSLGLPLEGK